MIVGVQPFVLETTEVFETSNVGRVCAPHIIYYTKAYIVGNQR